MLHINIIQENIERVINKLKVKNFHEKELIDKIIELEKTRRQTQNLLDKNLAEAKIVAKEIGGLFKKGMAEEANKFKERSIELKKTSKELSESLEKIKTDIHELLIQIPNIPHPSVPPGKSDKDNEMVAEEGTIPDLLENALPHWELAAKYDIIDFDLGSKITGAGFPVYKGKGARLQRALINFFLDEALKNNYLEIQPPLLVNEASAYGTGQLPDKDGQMYYVGLDNFYLIPTSEVPVTNIYRNVILNFKDLPVKNVAYSNCFRREAGSYGKDVRGLNRLHQFDKVEIVQIQHPEVSYETLEEMRNYVGCLIRKLDLPFRTLILCGGDLSFTSAKTYDFEVFSAAQKRWLEVSSVSNFENYQANRMKLRFKDSDGKTKTPHTLNGSALALPRIVAALLENNQTADGIKIPEVLVKYTGFELIN